VFFLQNNIGKAFLNERFTTKLFNFLTTETLLIKSASRSC